MIDRNYGAPDFPIVSNPFDNPNSPKTFSTELENTDTFNVNDIFDLGFLRSNPGKKIYQHKDKPNLFLEEIYKVDFTVKDRVARFIEIYIMKWDNWGGSWTQTVYYNSSKPTKEDIQLIINSF